MPTVVPPFVQYQTQLVPLRAIWNVTPKEGDRFTSAEIDWGVTTLSGTGNQPATAVQIDVGGNSPVAFSQIAALSVDNNRSAADVTFLFPDSAFELIVPAYGQGVFPVFTNALMFYVIAPQSSIGDVTTFQVFNSLPPPVAMLQSQAQAVAGAANVLFTTPNLTTPIIVGVSGIIETISLDCLVNATNPQGLVIIDGKGNQLWAGNFASATAINPAFDAVPIVLPGLKLRFFNGLNLFSIAGNGSLGNVFVYYSVP